MARNLRVTAEEAARRGWIEAGAVDPPSAANPPAAADTPRAVDSSSASPARAGHARINANPRRARRRKIRERVNLFPT